MQEDQTARVNITASAVVSGSCSLMGDGLTVAQDISRRIKSELGLTVSIGVSYNKIFANGWDDSPVKREHTHALIKSIGNSTTTPRDLETDEDVKIILYVLAESVAARLRENGVEYEISKVKGTEIAVSERTKWMV